MSPKQIGALIVTLLIVVIGLATIYGCIGKNDDQNWQIVQSLGGEITVRDEPGFYWKGFSTVWTYPRYMEFVYTDNPKEGDEKKESIRVTFNDGGTAQVSCLIRIQTPVLPQDRKEFHRQFANSKEAIKASVKAHLSNSLKAASPLMSASEHQAARKAEFSQIVENQLSRGLYEMRKVEKELKDRFDESGKPVTVYATEAVLSPEGTPLIAQPSPLTEDYKMIITQFSVTDTDYDPEILRQFAAKKQSFLLAEQSKAEREQAVQERLKIMEQGLRNKAEAEAIANVEKAKAVIAAQQKAEVALQTKKEAETKANQLLEVAKIEKEEALTKASKEFEVAEIRAKAAEQLKLAIIAEAEGKQKAIELSGEITNLEQALIDAEVKKAQVIADGIRDMQVPGVMFIGGSGAEGNGDAIMTNMINLRLLESTGLLEMTNAKASAVSAKRVTRSTESQN